VNLLDENIPSDQRDLLRAWGIRCRVIGQDLARLGIHDENIIVALHHLKQPTLFTRDGDFFKSVLCHRAYALVWIDAAPEEAALFVRKFLRHPRFRTKANRLGTVARVHHDGIHFWTRRHASLDQLSWARPSGGRKP